MKKSILLAKQHFFILLTILLILEQFLLPYKSNASSNINDGVISIHLIGNHNSDKYWFGQCLIPLKINAYMESGNHVGSIPVESSWISGYNSEKLGKQTVTITYGGKTTTFTVTVVDYLKSINVVELKQNYKVGETLDLSNTSITEITASGTKIPGKPITANMISGFNTSTPGVKKLTINYHKNELGENIKLDTFIIVSDSTSESSIEHANPVSTQTPNTNILEDSSPKSPISFDALKSEGQSISSNNARNEKTIGSNKDTKNTKNEKIIDSNIDTKMNLNNIIESIFEMSEAKLNEETIVSIKLLISVITRLYVLFI